MTLNAKKSRQLRGLVLTLAYLNHNRQAARLNSTLIWAILDREGYDFSGDDILVVLQDMRDRGYLRYEQHKDPDQHRLHIFQIEITADGRDLKDGLKEDAAVQL